MKRQSIRHPKLFDNPEDAKDYATRHQKMGKMMGKKFVSKLVKMGFKKGKILDIGTGPGVIPMVIINNFHQAEAIGLDLSDPLLELARFNAKESGLSNRLTFEKGDAQDLHFEDDFFDVVISLNTLHLVENPIAMLNEVERVLKPTGILLLGDIRRSSFGYFMTILKTAYTLKECKKLVEKSNLRPCNFEKTLFWVFLSACRSLESS